MYVTSSRPEEKEARKTISVFVVSFYVMYTRSQDITVNHWWFIWSLSSSPIHGHITFPFTSRGISCFGNNIFSSSFQLSLQWSWSSSSCLWYSFYCYFASSSIDCFSSVMRTGTWDGFKWTLLLTHDHYHQKLDFIWRKDSFQLCSCYHITCMNRRTSSPSLLLHAMKLQFQNWFPWTEVNRFGKTISIYTNLFPWQIYGHWRWGECS